MKILHVGQMIGGLDIYIRNSIVYAESGYEYVIVHGDKDNNKPIEKYGREIKEYRIKLYRDLNLWNDLKAIVQTVRIIKKERPDLIHCHSAKGGIVGRAAGFLTHTRTFYTPHAFSFLSAQSVVKRNIFLFIECITKFNARLLACSESEKIMGVNMVHYKKDRAFVWNNAVPDAINELKKKMRLDKYICYIGRPSYQKNPIFLVEVVKEVHTLHPEVGFCLLGVGYYSPELDRMKVKIAEYGLDKVIELSPWLSHKETLECVKNSMFYLTVARYEGLPLAVIEAMSLGKAIVASDVVGNRDCVEDGYNGRLLPFKKESFLKAICELVEDRQKRDWYGENSRTLFEKKFLITNRIKELEAIYQSFSL